MSCLCDDEHPNHCAECTRALVEEAPELTEDDERILDRAWREVLAQQGRRDPGR